MKRFYILRHGETDFNKAGRYVGQEDISLNERGINQAKELAEKIKNIKFDVIYSSPLKRAVKTAEIIKENQLCELVLENNLIERNLGVYQALTKKEAQAKSPELYSRNITRLFNEAPPQAETIAAVQERVFTFLDEMKESEYENILIVSHGFVAKIINKYFNQEISEEDFFEFSLKNSEIVEYICD